MRSPVRPILIAAFALVSGISRAAAQCAMCQASSASGVDGGASYNTSTLFMLSAPYLLLLAGAGYVAYSFRRARARTVNGVVSAGSIPEAGSTLSAPSPDSIADRPPSHGSSEPEASPLR